MTIRYLALMALLATILLRAPTVSACSLNPTAVISAPVAASSHIHGTVVSFNGSTSTANCGTIIGYLWKNGSTTLSTSPTFNYTVTLAPEQVDSVITVSLKVTSSHNARTHTIYRTITIKRDHQSQYFVKDHLGSPRVVVDGKGAVLSYTDYYPFGMVMPGRAGNISLSNDRVKFTGYLLEEEGEQDTYHAEARGYDPVIGRFTSVDPMASSFPGWSPYVYALNNPLIFIDPDGRFSTHVDSTGNVIAVYDDGDLGVYQHSDLGSGDGASVDERRAQNGTTHGGGSKRGETEYWDEFISPETGDIFSGARIEFGASWNPLLGELHAQSQGMNLMQIAENSRPGGLFDVKAHVPGGPGTGRLLNGKYTTARSAGNYLAGYNARHGTLIGLSVSHTTFMKMAGAVHTGNWNRANATKILLFGTSYGPPPYYGEIEYAGRMINKGWYRK